MKYSSNTLTTVGERLKNLRKKRGYSQEELAEIMHCSEKTISNRESGQDTPLKVLLEYCEVLDCDMGYLLGQYEEDDRDLAFISEKTGLSQNTIQHLNNLVSDDLNRYNMIAERFNEEFAKNVMFQNPELKFIDYCIPFLGNIVKNTEIIIGDQWTKELFDKRKQLEPLQKIYNCVNEYPDFSYFGQHDNEILFYDTLYEILIKNTPYFDEDDINKAIELDVIDDLKEMMGSNSFDYRNGIFPQNMTKQYINDIINKMLNSNENTYHDTYYDMPAEGEPDDWDRYQHMYEILDRISNNNKIQQFIISDTFMDIVKEYIEKEVKEKTK